MSPCMPAAPRRPLAIAERRRHRRHTPSGSPGASVRTASCPSTTPTNCAEGFKGFLCVAIGSKLGFVRLSTYKLIFVGPSDCKQHSASPTCVVGFVLALASTDQRFNRDSLLKAVIMLVRAKLVSLKAPLNLKAATLLVRKLAGFAFNWAINLNAPNLEAGTILVRTNLPSFALKCAQVRFRGCYYACSRAAFSFKWADRRLNLGIPLIAMCKTMPVRPKPQNAETRSFKFVFMQRPHAIVQYSTFNFNSFNLSRRYGYYQREFILVKTSIVDFTQVYTLPLNARPPTFRSGLVQPIQFDTDITNSLRLAQEHSRRSRASAERTEVSARKARSGEGRELRVIWSAAAARAGGERAAPRGLARAMPLATSAHGRSRKIPPDPPRRDLRVPAAAARVTTVGTGTRRSGLDLRARAARLARSTTSPTRRRRGTRFARIVLGGGNARPWADSGSQRAFKAFGARAEAGRERRGGAVGVWVKRRRRGGRTRRFAAGRRAHGREFEGSGGGGGGGGDSSTRAAVCGRGDERNTVG
ncbi:hypothetical protein B0H15DRAFT_934554 [Mycena belliarum]|uniref:Uncharacterized protein n=1 Tax=Mycena belliarum TaxID=1033014 RepID=A0AAD6TS72_9AGAR|nr:hypothetical protein B0H15DRAFT_934554 [Mycena belliae]